MSILDMFRRKTVVETRVIHDSDRRSTHIYNSGKTKYGNIQYRTAGYTDYSAQRENARGYLVDDPGRGKLGR